MKAMILSAGLGTRLKPFTDKHPKALALVNCKSLLQHNVEYLQGFGINDVIVNVHHFANQIIETIEENNGWGSNVTISDETSEVLETGGGLKKTVWYFEQVEDFVLMNVDILTDLDLVKMIAFHQHHKPLATLATTERVTSRYFLFDKEDKLCGWRNIKTGEEKIVQNREEYFPQAFSGIHIISSKIFALIKQEGKFSMVDVYLELARQYNIFSFDHSGGKLIDVGKPESIKLAEILFP